MTLNANTERVEEIARVYVESGKYKNVVSVYLTPDSDIIALHNGANYTFARPQTGIIDTLTRTHDSFDFGSDS